MSNVPRILLVEDSPMQAEDIMSAIREYNVEVLWVEDGQLGLQAVAEHLPDLIVLDLNLPKINGHQLCRRVKRDPQTAHIPVILLTATDNSDEMIKGLESGADDYIPKDQFAATALITVMKAMGFIKEEE